MDVAEKIAQGWKFQFVNSQLVISSEQDPNVHLELSAEAAFSLLDYLYQCRNALAGTTESNERKPEPLSQDTFAQVGSEETSDLPRREPPPIS